MALLLTPTLTGVLKRHNKIDLLGLDKYFNNDQLDSKMNKRSHKKSNSIDGLMEAAVNESSPFERNLRQVRHKKRSKKESNNYIDLEYRNTSSSKQKVKGKKIKMNSTSSKLGSRIRKLKNEVVLSEMVQGIKQKAKKKHMKIKRVLLGEKVKRKFHDKNLAVHLSKLLSMSNLKSHIRKMKRKLKSRKNRILKKNKKKSLKKKKEKQAQQTQGPSNQNSRGLAGMSSMASSSSSSKSGGGGKDNLMKFNFLPGFAGMPFPPFMMNGPHFHPPLNVTVNSLPNPNPRAELDPKEIEEENVKTQLKALTPINERLNHVLREVDSISKETEVNLEDKFQRVVQLNT
jgi:hypothetical protein